ncbi:MAG TPA: hypothetical protein VGD17_11660 [Chitinophagaceae bacterium]
MANKSTLPPSQDQKKFVQDEETGKAGATTNKPEQENQANRGYEEDQPGNPVRTTGSMRPDQESDLSSRETGPGCDNS